MDRPAVAPVEQARAIAQWIYAGRDGNRAAGDNHSRDWSGYDSLTAYSDRDWIIEIARQYDALVG